MEIELNEDDFELLENHRKNCDAIDMVEEGTWDTAWTFARSMFYKKEEGEIVKENMVAESIETRFDEDELVQIVLQCNDPDCNGKLAYPTDKILESINESIEV